MQEIPKCSMCNRPFNNYGREPLILPCHHRFCKVCISDQFEDQKKNQCSLDQEISMQRPNTLPLDNQLLKIIEEKSVYDNCARETYTKLSNFQKKNKELLVQLCQSKQAITEQMMKSLETFLFQNTNQLIKEIQNSQKQIEAQIQLLQKIIDQQGQQQLSIQQLQEFGNEQLYNQKQQQGQKEYNKLTKVALTINKNVEELLLDLNQQIPVGNIILQNAKSQEFKVLRTIQRDSKKQKQFIIETKSFSEPEVEIPKKPLVDLTYIEQINDQTLVMSGGFNGSNDYIIYENGNIINKQMIRMRYWHRTINATNKNFIISGGQQNLRVKECEFYSLSKGQFTSIADITIPVWLFGGSSLGYEIFIFGGNSKDGEIDQVQMYDAMTNE